MLRWSVTALAAQEMWSTKLALGKVNAQLRFILNKDTLGQVFKQNPTLDMLKNSMQYFQTVSPTIKNQDRFLAPLRTLYASQEVTVRTGHGTIDWFHIGKGVRQGCILSSCLFNLYAEYIMRNARLEEAHAGIKVAEKISITPDMQMTPLLWQKVKRH